MPQEFQVLRCYSCQTFQVHQVKKAKKWNCKVCGEKQSLLKVFGRGTGAECRAHTQKLNMVQGEAREVHEVSSLVNHHDDVMSAQSISSQESYGPTDRWTKYLDNGDENWADDAPASGTDCNVDGHLYTTDWNQFRGARKQNRHKNFQRSDGGARKRQRFECDSSEMKDVHRTEWINSDLTETNDILCYFQRSKSGGNTNRWTEVRNNQQLNAHGSTSVKTSYGSNQIRNIHKNTEVKTFRSGNAKCCSSFMGAVDYTGAVTGVRGSDEVKSNPLNSSDVRSGRTSLQLTENPRLAHVSSQVKHSVIEGQGSITPGSLSSQAPNRNTCSKWGKFLTQEEDSDFDHLGEVDEGDSLHVPSISCTTTNTVDTVPDVPISQAGKHKGISFNCNHNQASPHTLTGRCDEIAEAIGLDSSSFGDSFDGAENNKPAAKRTGKTWNTSVNHKRSHAAPQACDVLTNQLTSMFTLSDDEDNEINFEL